MNKENSPTIGGIMTTLIANGHVSPETMKRINETRSNTEDISEDPLYIKLLIGTGSWFTAFFMILFLFVSQMIKTGDSILVCGLVFLTAGIMISRTGKTIYMNQLSLALAIAGDVLVLIGATDNVHHSALGVSFFTQLAVCAVVYPLFRGSVYRFLASSGIAVIAVSWIIDAKMHVFIHALIAVEMIIAGMLLLQKKRPSYLTPLFYSTMIMLPGTILIMNLTQIHVWHGQFTEPLWPSNIILCCGLIGLYIHLAGGLKKISEPWLILTIFSTLVLGAFTTPGILVSIGLLVSGFAFGDRILVALSHLFMACFLALFYYALNIDLAAKSYIIAGSGLLLLIVRKISTYIQSWRAVQ